MVAPGQGELQSPAWLAGCPAGVTGWGCPLRDALVYSEYAFLPHIKLSKINILAFRLRGNDGLFSMAFSLVQPG